jgi:hypothetical protein
VVVDMIRRLYLVSVTIALAEIPVRLLDCPTSATEFAKTVATAEGLTPFGDELVSQVVQEVQLTETDRIGCRVVEFIDGKPKRQVLYIVCE